MELQIFRQHINRARQQMERMKWCLNEQTNAIAFKISMIKEISEVKMEEQVE